MGRTERRRHRPDPCWDLVSSRLKAACRHELPFLEPEPAKAWRNARMNAILGVVLFTAGLAVGGLAAYFALRQLVQAKTAEATAAVGAEARSQAARAQDLGARLADAEGQLRGKEGELRSLDSQLTGLKTE